MKNEKNYLGFLTPKIWQILKCFSGAFRRVQTTNPEMVRCVLSTNQNQYISIYKIISDISLLRKSKKSKIKLKNPTFKSIYIVVPN